MKIPPKLIIWILTFTTLRITFIVAEKLEAKAQDTDQYSTESNWSQVSLTFTRDSVSTAEPALR